MSDSTAIPSTLTKADFAIPDDPSRRDNYGPERGPFLQAQKACEEAARTGDPTAFFRVFGEGIKRQQDYDEYLHTDAWQRQRQKVLLRAAHKCERCFMANTALEVHHLKYGPRGREDLRDLIAVCPSCHSEIHDEGD